CSTPAWISSRPTTSISCAARCAISGASDGRAVTPDAIAGRFLAAQAVAREAGQLAAPLLADRGSLDVQVKGPQDFVTAADRAAEQLIAGRLAAAFPADGFLGEETHETAAWPDPMAPLWVADPIDGTGNFVHGRDEWTVSLGLLV